MAESDGFSDRFSRVYEAASQYKKLHTEPQDKPRRSVERAKKLQVELRREKANVADRYSEHARLRRMLLDRDFFITQWRFQLPSLTAERDRAVRDQRTLRDRITSLVTDDPPTDLDPSGVDRSPLRGSSQPYRFRVAKPQASA